MPKPALLWLVVALGAIGLAPRASAQILPLTVPKGQLRWDFYGSFNSYEWRWNNGVREDAAAAFSKPLDRNFVPGLAAVEDRVSRIANLNASLSLGVSQASEIVNLGGLGIGGAVGLTNRITIFGMIPIVQVQVRPSFGILPNSANTGLGPDNGTSLSQLVPALDSLSKLINAHFYDADPTLASLAQTTLARGTDLRGLLSLPASARFLPLSGSAIGAALMNGILALQQNLHGPLGIGLFNATPSLPGTAITAAEFDTFVTDPTGLVQAFPLQQVPITQYIGDIEVGAVFGLFDRYPKNDLGRGARSALKWTVRLRTARLAAPNRLFDLPTGDRQPDVQVDWVTDLASGRLGARLAGSYNLQLPGNQNRRVASPEDPISAAAALAGVQRDPGDEISLTARPFFRIAPFLSLYAGVQYWQKGEDKWSYAPGQTPIDGVDISIMGFGTKANALLLSGGLSYSHTGLDKRGVQHFPLDASIRYERIARSTVGILPDANTVRVDLRFYSKLF